MKSFFSLIGLAIAAATVGVFWLADKSPEQIGIAALSWFAFPYLWAACLAAALFLSLIRCRITATLCAVAVCITLPKERQLVSFVRTQWAPPSEEGLRFVTMNVQFFDSCNIHAPGKDPNWHDAQDSSFTEIFRDADIICLQETNIPGGLDYLANRVGPKLLKIFNGFPYALSTSNTGGFVTFSRYPLNTLDVCSEPNVFATEASLPNGKKLTIFNCHFQSLMLSKHEINSVSEDGVRNERGTLIDVIRKVCNAFDLRAPQVRNVSQSLTRVNGPLVICGDFNDTPVSYSYNTIATSRLQDGQSLSDAFVGSGSGIGRTFLGFPFPLRIDQLFVSEDISVSSFTIPQVNLSDHRPIQATLHIK